MPFTGKDDIFYVMISQGLLVPALIVFRRQHLDKPMIMHFYTSGLGLSNITKIRKRPMVIAFPGIIGTVTALWLYNNFIPFLNILNATLPPVGAIIMIDFFLNKENYRRILL